MAIPIISSIESGDNEVDLTFLIEKEGDDEWSIDYQYIETSENGGPTIVRTWTQLNEVYDPASLQTAKESALDRAADEWQDEDQHDLDDEGD